MLTNEKNVILPFATSKIKFPVMHPSKMYETSAQKATQSSRERTNAGMDYAHR